MMPRPSFNRFYLKNDTFLVIYYYLMVALVCQVYGLLGLGLLATRSILLTVLGFLAFTLTEYLLHRYVLHWKVWYARRDWSHTDHHRRPLERENFDINLPQGIGLGLIFFGLFWLLLRGSVFPFFSGFSLGYALYHYLHYIIHTSPAPKNRFRSLWVHHHIHHHVDDQVAYGVSSPFWDWVFGTLPEKRKTRKPWVKDTARQG